MESNVEIIRKVVTVMLGKSKESTVSANVQLVETVFFEN